MKRFALVDEYGIVQNIPVWDDDVANWTPPSGLKTILIENGVFVDIGYVYKDGVFSAIAL